MKKFLFAALTVMLLTTLCIVGCFTVMAADAANVEAGSTCPDGAHDFSVVEPVGDYYHQYVCSACGTASAEGQIPHRYDRWGHNDTQHWMECVCGAKKSDLFADAIADHVIDTTKWYSDGENHWNECSCGYKANVTAHSGGNATCVAKAVCDVCSAAYGEKDATAHAKDAYEWTLTETTHAGVYECCGLEVEETAHVWGEDHVCDVCSYVCTHTGGEANCTYLAVCDWCGKGYGELAPDNHHGGTATCLAEAVCIDCEQPYGEKDLDNHVSAEFIYVINADATKHDKKHACCQQVAETADHVGGTATCNALAQCELCLELYGDYDADNHAEGYVITWDITHATHSGAYSCCSAVIEETAHNWNGDNACDDCAYVCETHTGGTATCKTLAVCENCGVSYGELAPDNHESEAFDYVINADDATKHDKKNACCGAFVATEDHTGGEASCSTLAACEHCGEFYGALDATKHESEAFEYAVNADDATKHDKKHACCGAVAATEDHTGGEASCSTLAACEHCGVSYGELDATNHESEAFEYAVNADDATKHDKKHACCGAVAATEDHTGGEASCSTLAACEHCGEFYGELDTTKHESDAFTYEAILNIDSSTVQHVKKNACCGAVVATEDHTGGTATCMAKAVCELCNVEYGEKALGNHVAAPVYTSLGNGKHTEAYSNCCGMAMFYPEGGGEACTGGEASCTTLAKCEFCQGEYGTYDIDNHESDEVYYEYTSDDVHTQYHSCCNAPTGNSGTHVGGTATCQAQAVCTLCNTAYGTTDASNHVNTTEYTYVVNADDATKHDKLYVCCPTVLAATEEHTGGEATCVAKAACEHCGTLYGEFAPDNHASAEFKYEKTETHHTKLHVCCEAVAAETEKHNFENGICTVCEYVCPHTAGQYFYKRSDDDPSKHEKFHQCCGLLAETGLDHVSKLVNTDADAHWNECQDCGELIGDKVAHTYEYAIDAVENKHYEYCSGCNYEKPESTADHAYTLYGKDDNGHWNACVCGAKEPDVADVTHTYDIPDYDDEYHWNECVCGAKDPASILSHDLTNQEYDEGGHWNECTCGYKTPSEEHEYTVIYGGSDESYHWNKCACGAEDIAGKAAHTYENGVCVCTYVCLHGDAADHTYAVDELDPTKHNEVCHICALTLSTTDHDYTGWVVDEGNHKHFAACKYCEQKQDESAPGEDHTSTGAATCTDYTVCSVCGKSYGMLDTNNHTSTEYVYTPIVGNNKKHQQSHACCGAEVAELDHSYTDSKCTACGWECKHSFDATGRCTVTGCGFVCAHEGGEATCESKATCTVCGTKYGEMLDHTFGEWEVSKEAAMGVEGERKRTCSLCKIAETEKIPALETPWYLTDVAKGCYIAAGCVGGVAIIIVVVLLVLFFMRRAKAAKLAAEQKPWRTKPHKKAKWKKK